MRTWAWLFPILLAACGGEVEGAIDGGVDLTVTDAPAGSVDLAGDDLRGVDLAQGGGSAAPLTVGDQTLTITVGGTDRMVLLHVPAGGGPMPLVIALHGNGDTASNFVAALSLKTRADAAPFVLAAPQGIDQMPALLGGATVSWDAYTDTASNPDVAFLDAIKAQLGGSSTVAPKRVFVWGYSQGGYMSMRYGMDRSALLSCAGVIAAASPTGSSLITGAARKIAVAMQIGTNDFAIDQARATKTTLESNGNPLQYNEIVGAGHVPFPGDPQVPLDYCLGQALP